MHPVLTWLTVGPVPRPLGSYGLCVALGVAVGSFLILRAARKRKLDLGLVVATLGVAAMGAMLGAYGMFVLVRGAMGEWQFWPAGFVFYGGFVGAVMAAAVFSHMKDLKVLELADLSVVGVAVGHSIGRVGCFLGGCCFGAPSSGLFSVVYPPESAIGGISRFPVPVFESLFLLVIALGFSLTAGRAVGTGRPFLSYVAIYASGRFFLEFLRGDAIRGVFSLGLSTSQVTAAVAVFVALAVGWSRRRALDS